MTSLLPSSLQNSLQEILQQSNLRGASIRAILLSTTDGVPLGRVVGPQQPPRNEEVLSSIESVWAPASKQFPVLGLEKVKQVTSIYDHGTLIHIYQAPMVRWE
jgi:Mitogen-activated protein kinase kinase 1 interacting